MPAAAAGKCAARRSGPALPPAYCGSALTQGGARRSTAPAVGGARAPELTLLSHRRPGTVFDIAVWHGFRRTAYSAVPLVAARRQGKGTAQQ
ncbi:hypothetical protein NDU88_004380 [Pleurodeles waltl]|uniref:Uncharacterized protein n=1 Tax=Pleurodeles waltl TaxID=8319 RepID=A0AAV7LJL7_PLEWA|nr:hypothetical protein NDU88_004380 [Pleurodeles waltl]